MKNKWKLWAKLTCSIGLLLTQIDGYAGQSSASYLIAERYNIAGQLTGVIHADPDGSGPLKHLAIRNTFNIYGLLVKIESGYLASWLSEDTAPKDWGGTFVANAEYIVITYNGLGLKTSLQVLDGSNLITTLTQYSYDGYDRLECKATRMTPSTYNNLPASACAQTALNGVFGPDRITRYTYNNRDQILTEKRAVGTSLEQVYSTYTYINGQIESITDANGNYTEYVYDGFNRLSRRYLPSKSTLGISSSSDYEEYSYDANGIRTSLRKRDGNVISYVPDNLGQIIEKRSTANNVYYDYDLTGLELHARFISDNGVGVTKLYDGFGRIKTETNTTSGVGYTISNEYDLHSNRTKITHPDNSVYFTYHYDNLDRLISVKEKGTVTLTTNKYDLLGRSASLARGTSGALTSFNYDNISRLASIQENFSNNVHDNSFEYSYNPTNQLVELDVSTNAFNHGGQNGDPGQYHVNGLNQFTCVGSDSQNNCNTGSIISHDANGNLTSDGSTTYAYDIENRLTAASGQNNASLTYDPTGRLNTLTSGNNKTYFLYDGDALISEYNINRNITQRYVHSVGAETPLVQYSGNTITASNRQFLHVNHQSSVIAGTNSSGSTQYINTYDEYGVPGVTNIGRFAYTGQIYLPELAFYHYKSRMYSPRTGRFLQTDPVGYDDQLNLYAYVGNDPMNYTDPTGMYKCESGSDCETVTKPVENGGAEHTGETDKGTPRFKMKPPNLRSPPELTNNGSYGVYFDPGFKSSRMKLNINQLQTSAALGTTALVLTPVAFGTGVGIIGVRLSALTIMQRRALFTAIELAFATATGNMKPVALADQAQVAIKAARSLKPKVAEIFAH